MQAAFREGRRVSQISGSYLLQSSMKTSTGRVQPVLRSMRRETRRMGMYFAFAVVTMPVVALEKGRRGARCCEAVRMR